MVHAICIKLCCNPLIKKKWLSSPSRTELKPGCPSSTNFSSPKNSEAVTWLIPPLPHAAIHHRVTEHLRLEWTPGVIWSTSPAQAEPPTDAQDHVQAASPVGETP